MDSVSTDRILKRSFSERIWSLRVSFFLSFFSFLFFFFWKEKSNSKSVLIYDFSFFSVLEDLKAKTKLESEENNSRLQVCSMLLCNCDRTRIPHYCEYTMIRTPLDVLMFFPVKESSIKHWKISDFRGSGTHGFLCMLWPLSSRESWQATINNKQ